MIEKLNTPVVRMRRLRMNSTIRDLVSEHQLTPNDLVLPLFVRTGHNKVIPISSMPGHFQWTIDRLEQEITEIIKLGLKAVMLFGLPAYKDSTGSAAIRSDGVIQQAARAIKKWAPSLLIIADLCLCEYTDHGHCGVIAYHSHGREIDNDSTLVLLAKQAVSLAQAGADVIAPSGMMDGMVTAIRSALDLAGFQNIPILSYSVKYASHFYGPFREAANGAPTFGDRRSYQMDIANGAQAIREAQLDLDEGADMLMVKPALSYLDVISNVKASFPGVPIAAYQVSGEFAMIKAAAEKGWIDEHQVMIESLLSIKRAGADFIISYYAKCLFN